jgi:hypothetical protein
MSLFRSRLTFSRQKLLQRPPCPRDRTVPGHDGQILAELFDAVGNIQKGFTLTAPGTTFDVTVAEQF